jgi:hypothetical protein
VSAPALKPGFGPTLPALLRERFGVPAPVTLAVVLALVLLLGIVMLLVRPGSSPGDRLLHTSPPVFNLSYDGALLAPVDPGPGELARLEGERGRASVAVVVRPLELPPYRGDVAHGLLPTWAVGHAERLRGSFDGFRLLEERRARLGEAPGYEVLFRAKGDEGRILATDVLLVPEERRREGAVVLSQRREIRGRGKPRRGEQRLTRAGKKAFRSFRYGLDAP